MTDAFVYDIEIAKCIPDRKKPNDEAYEYCLGWDDHAGMGIGVVGVYDYVLDDYLAFDQANLDGLRTLFESRALAVSFNGRGFDDKILAANSVDVACETYDLLVEVWAADGLGPDFNFKTHGGYGLDAILEAQYGIGKSGNGADAPKWFQEGKLCDVINYCLRDVKLTKMLFDRARLGLSVQNPKKPGTVLTLRPPFEVKSVAMTVGDLDI